MQTVLKAIKYLFVGFLLLLALCFFLGGLSIFFGWGDVHDEQQEYAKLSEVPHVKHYINDEIDFGPVHTIYNHSALHHSGTVLIYAKCSRAQMDQLIAEGLASDVAPFPDIGEDEARIDVTRFGSIPKDQHEQFTTEGPSYSYMITLHHQKTGKTKNVIAFYNEPTELLYLNFGI